MKNMNRNIRVQAENNGNQNGFSIYLDFSGQKEYLMFHRHNGLLYDMLKDPTSVADLQRMDVMKYLCASGHSRSRAARSSVQLDNMVRRLLAIIDDYIEEKEAA